MGENTAKSEMGDRENQKQERKIQMVEEEERKIDIKKIIRDERETYQMREKDRDQKEERKIEMEDGNC